MMQLGSLRGLFIKIWLQFHFNGRVALMDFLTEMRNLHETNQMQFIIDVATESHSNLNEIQSRKVLLVYEHNCKSSLFSEYCGDNRRNLLVLWEVPQADDPNSLIR